MKKALVVLFTLLLLCACSSAPVTEISNGDDLFFTNAKGKGVTKQEIYENTKKSDISNTLKNTIVLKLATLEGINIEDLENGAKEYINSLVEQGYSEFITYYYGSEESYIKNSTVFDATNELCKKAINEDFDTYLNDYNPFKAEIIYVDEEDTAKAIIEYYEKNNSTFAYACSENGYESEISPLIYNGNTNDLPDEVNNYIKNADIGVAPVIKIDTVTTDTKGNSSTTSRYYLVNLVSKDYNQFKDEFLDTIVSDMDKDTVIVNLLNKYGIEVHDQDVHDLLKEAYGEVIK